MPLLENFYQKMCRVLDNRCPKLYGRFFKGTSLIKFFISGGIAGSVDLIFLFLFHGIFGWGIVISTTVAFLLSFLISFYLQRVWTFNNKEKKKVPRQLVLYMLNAFLSININGFGMHFLTISLGIWYILSQLAVNAILGGLNFYIYKFIIFRNDDEVICE